MYSNPLTIFDRKHMLKNLQEFFHDCRNKRSKGLGIWDDSPRFFDDAFGSVMSKTMFTGIHPDEDRYLNVREMMHLMGLPHDFEIDHVRNVNHIAQKWD